MSSGIEKKNIFTEKVEGIDVEQEGKMFRTSAPAGLEKIRRTLEEDEAKLEEEQVWVHLSQGVVRMTAIVAVYPTD